MNVRHFESDDELVRGVAETIVRWIERGARVFALSGGNTPKPIYAVLGAELKDLLAQYDLTWVLVDERFVPPDDPQSNLKMIRETLFASGMSPRHRLLEFNTTLPSAEESASDFEQRWRELGIEQLDGCILGVGDDGHTASLFPGTEALKVRDRVAVANYVPRLSMWRLTLTLPVLHAAKTRMVLAAGASKQEILKRIAAGESFPIVDVTSGEGETWWFVDRAAMPEV